MNEQNTQKLYADFPMLYRHSKNKQSCMQYGFSCGDGWFQIVYDLSKEIEDEAHMMGLKYEDEFWPAANQVKEKFGGLRFSLSCPEGTLERFYTIIKAHAPRADDVCETCGAPGTLRTDGWHRVDCDPCEAKRRKDNAK